MCVWMDERWETRAGQCSDAQLFGERLIFLVSCAPIQAGLLEQHIYPPTPTPPKTGAEQEKLEEESTLQLLIVIMISQGTAQDSDDELLVFLPFFLSSILFLRFLFLPVYLPYFFSSFSSRLSSFHPVILAFLPVFLPFLFHPVSFLSTFPPFLSCLS